MDRVSSVPDAAHAQGVRRSGPDAAEGIGTGARFCKCSVLKIGLATLGAVYGGITNSF